MFCLSVVSSTFSAQRLSTKCILLARFNRHYVESLGIDLFLNFIFHHSEAIQSHLALFDDSEKEIDESIQLLSFAAGKKQTDRVR